MGRSQRSSVQKYHDRVAVRYDHSYDDPFWQWHDGLTWDHLKTFLPRESRAPVVDLGCGTGKWGVRLLKSGFAVTFLDISHQMVDQARRKAGEMGCLDRANFIQADLSDLSKLQAGEFPLAVALGEPIGCTPTPARTMKGIRRILTDDGVLLATFDNRLATIDFYVERGDAAEVARFLKDGKSHWLTKDREERFDLITFSPEGVRKLVEGAGFQLLDMIGKTVLPMRRHRELLADSAARRRWANIEKSLCREPAAIGRAPHIQVACRVRPKT